MQHRIRAEGKTSISVSSCVFLASERGTGNFEKCRATKTSALGLKLPVGSRNRPVTSRELPVYFESGGFAVDGCESSKIL